MSLKNNVDQVVSKPVFRTVMFFLVVICVASLLIMLGKRSDAVTQARRLQAGVLTADEISTAFENVGGKLVKRHVNESDYVKKGQLLLELDQDDLLLSISSCKAQIDSMSAQITSQQLNIENARDKLRTAEISAWRSIEELFAQEQSARAEFERASSEFHRYASLDKASAVSKSAYDQAKATYLKAQSSLTSLKKDLQALTLGASQAQLEKLRREHDATGMTLCAISQQRIDTENLVNTLDSLKAQRKALQAQLGTLELSLKRTKLYAPEDGKIQEVLFDEGEMIPASTPVITLETDRRYYDVYISEKAVAFYKEGMIVTGFSPALDREISGTVRFVQAASSFADLRMTREQGQADLTSFKMRIYVDGDSDLLTGMTLEISDEHD